MSRRKRRWPQFRKRRVFGIFRGCVISDLRAPGDVGNVTPAERGTEGEPPGPNIIFAPLVELSKAFCGLRLLNQSQNVEIQYPILKNPVFKHCCPSNYNIVLFFISQLVRSFIHKLLISVTILEIYCKSSNIGKVYYCLICLFL